MATLGKIRQAVNRMLRPLGVCLERIPEDQLMGRTHADPFQNTFGNVVHCLVPDDTVIDLIRQRSYAANCELVQGLEKVFFDGDNYLRYRRSLEPLAAFWGRLALSRKSHLLDVGCALGQLVPFLQELGFSASYVGMDVAREFVSSARRRFGSASGEFHFMQVDACRMPFDDAFFDVVYSRGTLITTYEWKRALEEHLRVSKKWVLLFQIPFHHGQEETIFFMQHSKIHTSLLCSFTQQAFLSRLPGNAKIDIRPCGSQLQVINLGEVRLHDIFVELS